MFFKQHMYDFELGVILSYVCKQWFYCNLILYKKIIFYLVIQMYLLSLAGQFSY